MIDVINFDYAENYLDMIEDGLKSGIYKRLNK